jgi:cell division protein FtsW (lipid II flippase)
MESYLKHATWWLSIHVINSFVPSKLAAITIVLVLSNILFMHGEWH